MSALLFAAGWVLIAVVALLVLVLLVEVLAGWKEPPRATAARGVPPSYVVLMPAHNEAGTIGGTVRATLEHLPAGARLLVIADNCSDGTAAEARAAGAEVVERFDTVRRGKGYALAFGVDQLRAAPPQAVIILDADCLPAPGALDIVAAQAVRLGRPAQALYLMSAPTGSPLRVRMAAFAWALKNQVRALGLHRLGFPCQLTGSGMAFPWDCISAVDLATGHLTEDLQLGVVLAAAGQPAGFCPAARVESWFPQERAALQTQRTRWEHGHLSVILAAGPALLWRGLRTGRAGAVALALDLCVPPLALLAVLVLAALGSGAWMAGQGGSGVAAACVAAASLLAFAATVVLGWTRAGRHWVSLPELASAPLYVMKKLPVYAGFVVRRQKEWVRTSRQR